MRLYKIFLWSNILIALDAVGWTALTFQVLHLKMDCVLLAISWTFTWLFYTHDRLDISEADLINNPERSAWYASQKFLKPLMSTVTVIILGLVFMRLTIIVPAALGIIPCILYSKKLQIGGFTFSLKALPGMKALLVSFLWVLLTVVFPVMCNQSVLPSNDTVLLMGLMVGLFIMLQISTNDLRDIEGDRREHIQSFAVLLGDRPSRVLCIGFIALGVWCGWSFFESTPLLLFATFLTIRTILYNKHNDLYWQFFISLQGVLAVCLLK